MHSNLEYNLFTGTSFPVLAQLISEEVSESESIPFNSFFHRNIFDQFKSLEELEYKSFSYRGFPELSELMSENAVDIRETSFKSYFNEKASQLIQSLEDVENKYTDINNRVHDDIARTKIGRRYELFEIANLSIKEIQSVKREITELEAFAIRIPFFYA